LVGRKGIQPVKNLHHLPLVIPEVMFWNKWRKQIRGQPANAGLPGKLLFSDVCMCFEAACWSSDDTVLLFATANEPVVYMILFDEGNVSVTANMGAIRRAQSATPIIDLTPVDQHLEDLSSVR